MFQNNNIQLNNDIFSRTMQRRMEMMLQEADRLFSLGWLRKRLWKELKEFVNSEPASEFCDYRRILMGSFEGRFAWEVLSVHRKSLPDIRKRIENAFEGTNPLDELLEEREELIMEFARMPLSRAWENVKDDIMSWRSFARRMPVMDASRKDDICHFFEVLDRISVITDIACGHAKEYGLEVDHSGTEDFKRKQQQAKLTDELLIKSIEKCSAFLTTNSGWAVVFCVLRDDFGFDNTRQFERDIVELHFTKKLPGCPKETVSKTIRNNPYMYDSVNKWPSDKKLTKAAKAFRETLHELL